MGGGRGRTHSAGGSRSGKPKFSASFGEVEARLAEIHEVEGAQRTKFQARLKNFHRLGFPRGFQSKKGKASVYSAGDLVDLALALELTQLGLTPERVVSLLDGNVFATYQCVTMAARTLAENGAPRLPSLNTTYAEPGSRSPVDEGGDAQTTPSMFLFFDPAVLDSLRNDEIDTADATFFYGGAAVVQDNLVRWTSTREVRRLSLINVTTLLRALATGLGPDRRALFSEISRWAEMIAYPPSADTSEVEEYTSEELAEIQRRLSVDFFGTLSEVYRIPRYILPAASAGRVPASPPAREDCDVDPQA